VCVSIHSGCRSCSDVGRVLVLNDPTAGLHNELDNQTKMKEIAQTDAAKFKAGAYTRPPLSST